MQLWLKEGIGREFAMNKPRESEIWPNARPVKFKLWPSVLPDGMKRISGDYDVKWELESLTGAEMKIDVDGSPREYLDEIALVWRVVETYRTHCPYCWEKMEGSAFLAADMGGHQAFLCPAGDDWDDRFPREE